MYTPEQLTKAKAAKSIEELLALAKAEGIEASEEEIKAQFAELHREGEIADEELGNISGGCGEEDEAPPVQPEPRFHAGQRFMLHTRIHEQVNYLNIRSEGEWFETDYYYLVEEELTRIAYKASEQEISDNIV